MHFWKTVARADGFSSFMEIGLRCSICYKAYVQPSQRENTVQMKTLRYCGFDPTATGYGWATCNANLRAALAQHFTLTEQDGADVDFVPLTDHALNPICTPAARVRLGYTFFESPLDRQARDNSEQFDTVFAGSTWCVKRLEAIGVTNARLLMQGVDETVFHPGPCQPDGSYRIFSGGKCEYRKGQDLVIDAFVKFAKSNPDAHLVCAWRNPWPGLIHFRNPSNLPQEQLYRMILLSQGLTAKQFTILPALSAQELADEMRNTDIGLFPNRCEGGTNLVAMEYLSCGRPIVANLATGHADLAGAAIHPIAYALDDIGWARQDVNDIVSAMNRARSLPIEHMACPRWTWQAAAQTVAAEVERLDSQN